MNLFTTDEKMAALEKLIETLRRTANGVEDNERIRIMGAIATDLRARINAAPTVALTQIERRMTAVMRHKTRLGYETGTMVGFAEEVIGRWSVVKQALEKFGAEVENEKR